VATQKEVVYPSVSAFSGTSQLNIGPFAVPSVVKFLRAEVRGRANFQGGLFGATSVEANFTLWGLQQIASGGSPLDVVTSTDDDHWLIREQLGSQAVRDFWAPSTDTAAVLQGDPTDADWAGNLVIGASIDLYLSMRAPTGVAVGNMNYFGSIRFWWS
jgi:hypothetical protein